MEIQHLLRKHLPGYAVTTVTRLGEGWDNLVYEVNGELLVRFSKEPDEQLRREAVEREVALLDSVRRISPLAVPHVSFADPGAGMMAYPKLDGVPLSDCRNLDVQRTGQILAEFCAALAQSPITTVVDDTSLQERLDAARADFALVEHLVRNHAAIGDFLARPVPDRGADFVFCHNDLGAEHVLAGPDGVPVAVIDWTDAAMSDPAYDPGMILRDLGPAAFDAMGLPDLAERAWFYARTAILGDIAYGVRRDQPHYVTEGLAHLDHLF